MARRRRIASHARLAVYATSRPDAGQHEYAILLHFRDRDGFQLVQQRAGYLLLTSQDSASERTNCV